MHEVNASNRVDICSGNNLQPMLFAIYTLHTTCIIWHTYTLHDHASVSYDRIAKVTLHGMHSPFHLLFG